MGYRGKIKERDDARRLRGEGYTMPEIARKLRVSRSSVSLWTRDVDFTPRSGQQRRYRPRTKRPNKLQRRKQEEINRLKHEARDWIGQLSDREFLVAGTALYAGDGSKTDGKVNFANSNSRMIAFFCAWLRGFFEVDESRLRVRLYLHKGLDLDGAEEFWSQVTGIPREQFGKAYRAIPDAGIRNNKHVHGCAHVGIACSRTHRTIMGLIEALLSSEAPSGVAQLAERSTVNRDAVGSSPTPGAPQQMRLPPKRAKNAPCASDSD